MCLLGSAQASGLLDWHCIVELYSSSVLVSVLIPCPRRNYSDEDSLWQLQLHNFTQHGGSPWWLPVWQVSPRDGWPAGSLHPLKSSWRASWLQSSCILPACIISMRLTASTLRSSRSSYTVGLFEPHLDWLRSVAKIWRANTKIKSALESKSMECDLGSSLNPLFPACNLDTWSERNPRRSPKCLLDISPSFWWSLL